MGIAPERDIEWRGTNGDTVIEDADLQYTGYFYPGEDIHPGEDFFRKRLSLLRV